MKRRQWLAALALALLALSGARAQTPAQPPTGTQGQKPRPAGEKQDDAAPGQISNITVNVRLPVTVTNEKTKRFVVDLKQSDFQIYEDKVQQEILSFVAQSDLPLDVAVLMDTSNSVKPKLKFEKDAAVSFLQTMLTSRKDRALFATFDSQVELHQDFTNRLDLLTRAIDKVKAQGETRMYDAIFSVCEEKMMAAANRRRAMVIITDGEDTVSEHSLAEAIDLAQRSETVIFIISTKAGGFFGVEAGTVDRKEDKDIKRLAEETGGRAFFTAQVIELERSFSAIALELRSQYQISYSPTNENFDGKFRQVEVRLPNFKDMKIRAKRGYAAVPSRATTAKQQQ
ncbi:MAG: VWA domain-containing protein [Blastocatellia bacterium]|nr:VWA domain-containing protein [Blastocatellia bacterium]